MSVKSLRLLASPSFLRRRARDSLALRSVRSLERKTVWFFNWSIAWALAFLFPYGTHAVRTTLRLGVYLGGLGVLGAGGLWLVPRFLPSVETSLMLGGTASAGGELWDLILAKPVYAGVAFAVWYLLGIFTYTPGDRKNYRANQSPENKSAQWLFLSAALLVSIVPTGYLVVSVITGESGLLVVGGLVVATVVPTRWFHRWLLPRVGYPNKSGRRKKSHHYRYIVNESYFGLAVNVFAVTVIAVFFDAGAAFAWHLVWMLYLARRMRWILYEDKMGFKETMPTIWAWALVTRLPVLYAAVVVLRGGGIHTEVVGFASFVPLLIAPLYLIVRHSSLGGTMHSRTYQDYEQMTEYEERRHKMDKGFALLAGGRKPPSEAEVFAGRARTLNRTLDGVQRALDGAWGTQKTPRIRTFPTDPDSFNPEEVEAAFETVAEFLDGHPSDEAWVRLQNARQDFDHAMRAYEYHRMAE